MRKLINRYKSSFLHLKKVHIMRKKLLENIKDMKNLKDIHKGERCFIIGNGPSLTPEDLDMLKEEITFSTNRIYKILDKTAWRPYYYCVSDNKIMNVCKDEINSLVAKKKFLTLEPLVMYNMFATDYPDAQFYHQKFHSGKLGWTVPVFSDNIVKGITCGHSVTYICIQIAAYMGFSKIYLIGCDHTAPKDMVGKKTHFYELKNDSNYEYALSNNSYKAAKKYAKKNGFEIINITRGGSLEIFERKKLEEIL